MSIGYLQAASSNGTVLRHVADKRRFANQPDWTDCRIGKSKPVFVVEGATPTDFVGII